MSASLTARTKGKVAQYQLSGTGGLDSTAITPAAAVSTIIGTVPPGKAGIRLTSPVIQNAADLTAGGVSSTNESLNFLPSTSQPTANGDPTVNSAQLDSNGLSLSPQHE